jgi:hypothetical protein
VVPVRRLLAQLLVLDPHIPAAVAEVHRMARHKEMVEQEGQELQLFVMLVQTEHIR